MAEEWYYSRDGSQRHGPVALEALRQYQASGQLQPTDLIWRPGMADWTPAANVPEMAAAANSRAPVAPQSTGAAATPAAPGGYTTPGLGTLRYAQPGGSGELLCTPRTLDLLRATKPW